MSRLLCCASAGSVFQPAGGVLFQGDEGSQDGDHEATVRDELQCLPLSSLIKRASDDGVDPQKLADAMDSNNPKAAHIELIVARASVDSRHLRHELVEPPVQPVGQAREQRAAAAHDDAGPQLAPRVRVARADALGDHLWQTHHLGHLVRV